MPLFSCLVIFHHLVTSILWFPQVNLTHLHTGHALQRPIKHSQAEWSEAWMMTRVVLLSWKQADTLLSYMITRWAGLRPPGANAVQVIHQLRLLEQVFLEKFFTTLYFGNVIMKYLFIIPLNEKQTCFMQNFTRHRHNPAVFVKV